MESPDTIHGRMKEGAHLAGYSLQRTLENLRWLLEDRRYKELSPDYSNVNEFLRDTADAFKLLKIDPTERKEIARLVKDAEPEASQRAIADMVGVGNATIARDLGYEGSVSNETSAIANQGERDNGSVTFETPAIPPDDFDPVERERKERQREEKKEQREQELQEQIKELETHAVEKLDGVFDVIVVDPPWPYGTQYDPNGRRAANPYPEMDLDDLAEIDFPAADNCVLWLWTTHKFMRDAFWLLDDWGFRDVAIVTWVKDRMGLGTWLRSQSEFCIMAVKGKPIIKLTNQTTVISGPMREHSRKPDSFYEMVSRLCPGRKTDYFSREERAGWEQYGNDTSRFRAVENHEKGQSG